MNKGLILMLGVLTVGCTAKNKYQYYCMTPIGPVVGEPTQSKRVGDTITVKNELGQEAQAHASQCVGVKEKE